MDREQARRKIDSLDYYLQNHTDDYEEESHTAMMMAIEALEQTRWIPVSERLPEVNQRVLVTSYGRVCYAMMTSVDGNSGYPIFRLQDSLNERVICETTVHSEWTTSRITAWMPLPQPYKGESEKINCKATKCENCTNHNYCDYEPQESEDKE